MTTVEAIKNFEDRKTKVRYTRGQRFEISNHRADGMLGAHLVVEIGPRIKEIINQTRRTYGANAQNTITGK